MDWLSDWLKNVIMVVLFAAFVDLILPGKALERYARLVLSLIILLTLLSPIIRLLTDPPEQRLAQELERQEKGLPQEMQLESILAQAEKLKDVQQSQSLEWAGSELARVMKEEIAAETGEAVQEVEVVLAATRAEDDSYTGADIRSVDVKLSGPSDAAVSEEGSGAKEPIGITPVESIEVNLESGTTDNNGSQAPSQGREAASKEYKAREEQIVKYISQRWDLNPDLITIHLPEHEQDDKKL